MRRGYRLDNPCARLETVTIKRKPPQVFTPLAAAKCLLWLSSNKPEALMWFALSTFCGLRPEETDHIQKSQIHASEGWIRVEISKVKQRRVVYPTKEAMRLVKACMKLKGWPLTINQRRRAIRALRNRLGWKEWPKDITRHSAASYWLATSQSAASVAESLGHSESVLKRHYKALVTKKQALQFWAVAEKMAKRIGAG